MCKHTIVIWDMGAFDQGGRHDRDDLFISLVRGIGRFRVP